MGDTPKSSKVPKMHVSQENERAEPANLSLHA